MTLAIAHRGDTARYRENTLPAIRSAVAQGAGMVAIDLKLTADGHIVLLRDDTLDRMWGLPHPIANVGLAELAALGVSGEYRVPTLMEVLAETAYVGPVPLMLGVSSVETGLATEAVVYEYGLADHVLYTGSVDAMRAIRARRPSAALALTWDQPMLPPTEIWQTLRPRFYNCHHALLTRELIAELHRYGYAVSAWTVNDFEEMVRLMGMGIDAILTEATSDLVALAGGRPAPRASRQLPAPREHGTH